MADSKRARPGAPSNPPNAGAGGPGPAAGGGGKRHKSDFTDRLGEEYAAADDARWQRTDLPPINPKQDGLTIQLMDIDMYEGRPMGSHPAGPGNRIPGARSGAVPVIRAYGVTDEGHSMTLHIHGFTPYFYCAAPPGVTAQHTGAFQSALNVALKQKMNGRGGENPVVGVQFLDNHQSLLGFQGDRKSSFFKVYTAMPTCVTPARRLLEDGFSFAGCPRTMQYQVYEAKTPFVLRFMIDSGLQGCSWVQIPAGHYTVRPRASRQTACQLEFDLVYTSLTVHQPEGEWQRIAPFRILSFDIECCSRDNSFPKAEQDPVIQIANVVTEQGAKSSVIRNVFVLGSCTPINGANVLSFDSEKELLEAWARFVRESDPDVITGYNVMNFDIPYILDRAAVLGATSTALLGRVVGLRSTKKNTTFQSSAYGKRENVETDISGRVIFDMLQYMFRNHKMSSYSLNAVCAEFLGEQKEDVHHSIIGDLHRGDANDRHRLAVYCLKDAWLPQRLMDKLMVMVNHIEMARVTGVPLDFLLRRGQQIKVMSMLHRKCRPRSLLIPVISRKADGGDGVAYEGATVIEPKRGFYNEPVATLDFASLYPSIMMAHNLCYSTLLHPSAAANMPEDSYERTPNGDFFVKKGVKKGLLPEILEELLTARKKAKKDMKAATDPMVKAVQNGRQLALKISANSVYGFTGATVGQLPCLPISSSVTAYGRDMIHQTKSAVEELYTVANGYPADAVVVYGDTDSVMVKFGVPDVAESMRLGEEAATRVTELFPKPVRLEFEKVYFPYLLMNKKRYAGLYWTKPEKWDKLDTKGIETVRRDNCALVRRVVDKVLHKILRDRSVPDAIAYAKGVIRDLLQDKVDISMLVITKSLGKAAGTDGYKAKMAHVELAERMRKRDPASAPKVGDRVPYVIVQGPKGTPQYMKSEDPLWVLEHGLQLDTKWYLEHQLENPLTRIFSPIMANPKSLFTGDHTRSVRKHVGGGSKGIMAFAVKTETCMFPGCRVPLSRGQHIVCQRHAGMEGAVFAQKLATANEREHKFAKLWTHCQRCQGSLTHDVICSAKDCPIFYMRRKVQKDLDQVQAALERFGTAW